MCTLIVCSIKTESGRRILLESILVNYLLQVLKAKRRGFTICTKWKQQLNVALKLCKAIWIRPTAMNLRYSIQIPPPASLFLVLPVPYSLYRCSTKFWILYGHVTINCQGKWLHFNMDFALQRNRPFFWVHLFGIWWFRLLEREDFGCGSYTTVLFRLRLDICLFG